MTVISGKEDQSQSPEERRDRRFHSAEGTGIRLSVSVSGSKQAEDKEELLKKYEIRKYNLSKGLTFSSKVRALIPHDISDFYDKGENYVERVMRSLQLFKQCALVGPTGTGKTHLVYLIAELAGLPLWEINCGLQTSSYDLFGRYVGLGKDNWVDGQIVMWCRNGGILYLDEANMMRQDVATRLNPLLDSRGHIVLSENDNDVIPRHPAGYLIISMNPFAPEFAGTKPLNIAFRRRMSVWLDFDYLSVGTKISQEEIELVSKRSKVSREISTAMVRIGAELRSQYKSNELPYAPSVGDLANWALLVSNGVPPVKAAEETIIAMTSDNPDVQDNVRRLVRLIFSDSAYSLRAIPRDLNELENSSGNKTQANLHVMEALLSSAFADVSKLATDQVISESETDVDKLDDKSSKGSASRFRFSNIVMRSDSSESNDESNEK